MRELKIENLNVSAEENKILNGIDYTFKTGKVYAIIGPNGNGKSTLLSSIMGDPNYEINEGKIILDGEDITESEVDERANKGIYMLMQYPSEIEGVSNINLIKTALEKRTDKPVSQLSVYADAEKITKQLKMEKELIHRDVNVGFSGGEKKKNELLHLFTLKPSFAFLDEVDSGLDVDSIVAVSQMIKKSKTEDNCFVIVSHYKKLYEEIKPDIGLIIRNGKIDKEVDYDGLMDVLNNGFDND